jgi:hypothetical protein
MTADIRAFRWIMTTATKRQASHANGTKFGRPKKVRDTTHVATARRMKADGHAGKDIARYLGGEPGDAVSVSWRTHWLTSGGIHAALHGLDISRGVYAPNDFH